MKSGQCEVVRDDECGAVMDHNGACVPSLPSARTQNLDSIHALLWWDGAEGSRQICQFAGKTLVDPRIVGYLTIPRSPVSPLTFHSVMIQERSFWTIYTPFIRGLQ